jgi:hypothetical protein
MNEGRVYISLLNITGRRAQAGRRKADIENKQNTGKGHHSLSESKGLRA